MVATEFAELCMPMVTVSAGGNDGGRCRRSDMTPAELLAEARKVLLDGRPESEAGNISVRAGEKTPIVRCPLCWEAADGALFARGRPFRMHLLSPVHNLSGQIVAETVAIAEANAAVDAAAGGSDRPVATADSSAANITTAFSGDLGYGCAVKSAPGDEFVAAAAAGDLKSLRSLVAELRKVGEADTVAAQRFPCDRHGATALHWAAGMGHLEVCRWLVEHAGVDPDERCTSGRADGRTALHWAARNGKLEVVRWLVVEHRLDPDTQTNDGTSPFHWAVWQQQHRVCRWLRDAGADTSAVNTYGCNAIHWAALTGRLELCVWLGWQGVDVAKVNKQGHTALHKAAYNGHIALVRWLVSIGAVEPGLVDNGGYTAAAVARERGFLEVSDALEQYKVAAAGAILPSPRVLRQGAKLRPSGPVGALGTV